MANHEPNSSNVFEAIEAIEIVQIFVSSGHAYWTKDKSALSKFAMRELSEVECIAGRGLRGDRYCDGRLHRKGQVTLIHERAIQEIRDAFQLGTIPAENFRRNLVVRGVELDKLLHKRFEIDGVLFEGSQECKPCQWMDRVIAPGAMEFMRENYRGGLRAKILTDGIIKSKARSS